VAKQSQALHLRHDTQLAAVAEPVDDDRNLVERAGLALDASPAKRRRAPTRRRGADGAAAGLPARRRQR
jgi:hypothetical protein